MSLYQTLSKCLGVRRKESVGGRERYGVRSSANMLQAHKIVTVLETAEKPGQEIHARVDNIVQPSSWTESLATCVLERLQRILQDGTTMGPALKEAFDKAVEAACDFAQDHPVYTTIIALGILAILLPWVIEALGFAELGPVEGSFAAWWQSTYAGYVPAGSLFSFFQRLGMVWK